MAMRARFDMASLWHDGRAWLRARWYFRRAAVGARVRVWGRLSVSGGGRVTIGDRVRIVSTIATTELAVERGATLSIGANTFINYGCSIGATKRVSIGADCNIGSHVIMMDSDFHCVAPERRTERPDSAPIVLEDNVWLGARVIVLRGVTIGTGSVIGAGSVVTRDIPARSIAAGQPAKVIRSI